MTMLTILLIKKNIQELKEQLHEIYLAGADRTNRGQKEIERIETSIKELENLID